MKDNLGVIELLAKNAHDRWANWMDYVFSNGRQRPDGSFIIEAEEVSRWMRQMETEYEDLTSEEQRSDIWEATNELRLVANFYKKQDERAQKKQGKKKKA